VSSALRYIRSAQSSACQWGGTASERWSA
jgi:hypothetical protein